VEVFSDVSLCDGDGFVDVCDGINPSA